MSKRGGWNPEEDACLLALLDGGTRQPQIAETMGRSRDQIRGRIAVLRSHAGHTPTKKWAKWSPEQIETLRRMFSFGASDHEIGRAIGASMASVSKWRSRLGLVRPKRVAATWTYSRTERLKKMFEKGLSDTAIAAAVGMTRNAVISKRGRLGLLRPKPERMARTPRAPQPQFWTGTRSKHLQRLVKDGLDQLAIANEIGCSDQSVRNQLTKLRAQGWDVEKPRPGEYMVAIPLDKLENAIVQPGFEKHLEPLLHYRGSGSLGRVHRLWNFVTAMMLQDCRTMADATQRLAMNEAFSHLCGPPSAPQTGGLSNFLSRVLQTPRVHGENPQLIEYIRSLNFRPLFIDPLPEITHDPRARWVGDWRTYVPRPGAKRKRRDPGNVRERAPKVINYPFLIHDGGREEHRLLRLVNDAVPKYLPPDLRADICQDLIVGLLCGDFAEDDLRLPVKEMTRRVQKMFPSKYGPMSLDAIVPGTDSLRLIDTLSDELEWT